MKLLPEMKINLVVTGGEFDKVFKGIDFPIPVNVIRTGYVDDNELAALYKRSKALIVPSLYEGFGFPVLEGLAFGTPVISSNAASLPEVGGNVVTYFNPNKPGELAEIIRENAFSFDKDAVARHLAGFSWKKTAKSVLEILRRFG